jgi:hypothetical protein
MSTATTPVNGSTPVAEAAALSIPRLDRRTILVPIKGTAPLIVHRFAEKARRQMLDKMQGRKAVKEVKDPAAEFEAAKYLLDDGRPGFPSVAFKAAMVSAARFFDKSVTMVTLRQTVFLDGLYSTSSRQKLVAIQADDAVMREDVVTVGVAGHDLRYRPEYANWRAVLPIHYVASSLNRESVLALVDAAGTGVGVGEWRPEKNGDFGTFEVDSERNIEEVSL